MTNKNEEILILLYKMNNDLEYIKQKIDKDSNTLNSHINFIETIYDTLKSPISYICNKFNKNKVPAIVLPNKN
jgi:hypothetical protein